MTSHIASDGVQPFPFRMDSSAYRQNSQYCVAIATFAGVATAFIVQAYHPTDVHFTPGQVTVNMGTGEKSISTGSIWPSSISSSWVTRLFDLCSHGNEEAALKEVSLVTTDFKSSMKFQQLADDFLRLNFAKLPDIILISLLRNTYSIRMHIPTWNALLIQTEQILTNHRKNPRALLRGLKKF